MFKPPSPPKKNWQVAETSEIPKTKLAKILVGWALFAAFHASIPLLSLVTPEFAYLAIKWHVNTLDALVVFS